MNAAMSLFIDNNKPLVSIVIPAFNHGFYLHESIQSVLEQDYKNLELIVINDGSTDNTKEILDSFGEKIISISQTNQGQSLSLKLGWSIANGNILGYLSADDILAFDAVSKSVEALSSNQNIVATFCDFSLIDPNSKFIRSVKLTKFSYEKMLGDVSCPIGPGAFFRRSAYNRCGPWNPRYKQMPDYDFWLRLGIYGDFLHLPFVLASYRVHSGSQTYSITKPENAIEPILIVQSIFKKSRIRLFEKDLKNRALANANLVSAQLHLRASRYILASKCIRQAMRHSIKTVLSKNVIRLLFNAAFNRSIHRIIWSVRSIFKEN